MGSRLLVGSEIDEGTRLLQALDRAGVPIEVAFWLLTEESSEWHLVLATSLVEESSSREAYRRILDVQRTTEDVEYISGNLTIVGMNDRRVQALREALPTGIPRPGYHLGRVYARDVDIDDSYVYRVLPSIENVEKAMPKSHQSARNGTASSPPARTAAGA